MQKYNLKLHSHTYSDLLPPLNCSSRDLPFLMNIVEMFSTPCLESTSIQLDMICTDTHLSLWSDSWQIWVKTKPWGQNCVQSPELRDRIRLRHRSGEDWKFLTDQWPPSSWNGISLEQSGLHQVMAVQEPNDHSGCCCEQMGESSRRSTFAAALQQSELYDRVSRMSVTGPVRILT